MKNIAIQPMQWERLPNIHDVKPFNDDDAKCFEEVRDVLKKHNALDRFGLSLLHNHFSVSEDEILLESTDIKGRRQMVEVINLRDADNEDYIVTNWKLTEGEEVAQRTCTCSRTGGSLGGHTGGHMVV